MLFKALIERLLGSDEAQDWKDQGRAKTSRFSYDDFPLLVGILTDLLDPKGALKQSIEKAPTEGSPFDLHGAEGVFPALQILRQARPPLDSLPPIIASIETLLSSPHWHLRDMAARTLVSLYPTDQLGGAACALFKRTKQSNNAKHGILLAAKYLIREFMQSSASISKFRTLGSD